MFLRSHTILSSPECHGLSLRCPIVIGTPEPPLTLRFWGFALSLLTAESAQKIFALVVTMLGAPGRTCSPTLF